MGAFKAAVLVALIAIGAQAAKISVAITPTTAKQGDKLTATYTGRTGAAWLCYKSGTAEVASSPTCAAAGSPNIAKNTDYDVYCATAAGVLSSKLAVKTANDGFNSAATIGTFTATGFTVSANVV